MVKAFPPPTANELKPFGDSTFQSTFGPLAGHVWRAWGVRETLDWGRIVFLLVEEGLLNRQETDSLEDFRDGFEFDAAFEGGYRTVLAPDLFGPTGAEGDR